MNDKCLDINNLYQIKEIMSKHDESYRPLVFPNYMYRLVMHRNTGDLALVYESGVAGPEYEYVRYMRGRRVYDYDGRLRPEWLSLPMHIKGGDVVG